MPDGFDNSPIMGPYLKALQLFHLITNTRNQAEDRRLKLEDRQRDIANDKFTHDRLTRLDSQAAADKKSQDANRIFDNRLNAEKEGAQRITNVGELWFSKNLGSSVPGAPGEMFKFPSADQKEQREVETFARKETAK